MLGVAYLLGTPLGYELYQYEVDNPLEVARSGGFEPPTAWFVARYSIQLSYEREEERILETHLYSVKWILLI